MTTPSLTQRCATAGELQAWIKYHLGLSIPGKPMCPAHSSPMEYLWQAYNEPAQDLVVWAPRGGGKTTLGAIATLLDLLHKPGCQVRILGGSLEQSLRMWESLSPMLRDVAGDLLPGKESARRMVLKNGSAAAVLTQSQRAVRGLRVQRIRCDEVELFKPEIWQAAQLATRSRSAGEITLSDDCTQTACDITCSIEAMSTLHEPFGLMQDIVDAATLRGTPVLKWCLLDVLEHCPRERQCTACALAPECKGRARAAEGFFKIDDALRMKGRVSKQTWESEMLCLRPARTMSVFAEFNPDLHVRATPPWGTDWPGRDGTWGCGIDFGYTNPFVCLWIQFDSRGRCFVSDEYVQTTRTLASHIAELSRPVHPRPLFVGVDPAGEQSNSHSGLTSVRMLRDAGYDVRFERVGIMDSLDIVHTALSPAVGQPTLCIHPRCTTLIKSMTNYRFGRLRDENPKKDNVNDHAVDALRYFLAIRTTGQTRAGRY